MKSVKRHEIYLKGMNLRMFIEAIGKVVLSVWEKKHELRIVGLTPDKIVFDEFVVSD